MSELFLDVRLDGFPQPAGVLVRDANGGLAFAYSLLHLASPSASPLSLSLPISDEPYGDVVTRAFFGNLLQERDASLTEVLNREALSRDDIAGLLLHLGKDCPGALSVLPAGAPPVKVPGDFARDYVVLTDERMLVIAKALHERGRLPTGMQDPSPLAGVQSKVALTLLPDGEFAEPKPGSGAPTTHILKVPDQHHRSDCALEAATLNLSRALGVQTAQARVMDIGGIDVLLITRFDRCIDADGRVVRLHQEDFAQALGLPSSLKYERNGMPGRRFDALAIRRVLDATLDPATERVTFIRATLFDLLTGNVDGHAKNHALLHLGGGSVRLAPRYDLLPTRLDQNFTDQLAFKIGAAETLAAISKADFDAFLKILGIVTPAARRRIGVQLSQEIADGLADTLDEIANRGMKAYADLIAANMRQLLPVLGAQVPLAAQNRDAYVQHGGGWLTP